MTATECPTASSHTSQPTQRMTQNYLAIWVDGTIDESEEDFQKKLAQLHNVINQVNIFKKPDECIQFLDTCPEKVFVIVTGFLGQDLVPKVHNMRQLHTIYIYCGNKARHEQWAQEWSKIEGVFTSIQSICESLKKVVRRCDHNAISMSFVPKRMTSVEASSDQRNLDQLEPILMYSILFKEIILEIDDGDDATSLKDLVAYCRQQKVPESQLNHFQNEYHNQSPVWWYTKNIFLFGMLNRALREFNTEAMIKMSFFIRNLHRQLEKLQKEQFSEYRNQLIVYRGQGLTQQDFQRLLEIKNGLLSFNSFLSTSKEQEVPMAFADIPPHLDNEIVGVLFIMTIDFSQVTTSKTPFANIQHDSAFETEEEVLFSMHTVFRVGDIKQSAKNNRIWEVQLILTDDDDPQLASLIEYMKVEMDGTGWRRIGQLLLKAGHFDQAEILYNELLKNASSDSDRSYIYNQLGWLKDDQGQYKDAASFYEQSLAIKQKNLKEDDPSLADTYNDLGIVYKSMGDYSKALVFYEKTFEIDKKTLPPNHPDLAISYNNIGQVYSNMGDYSKALEFYEKSLEIREKALPPNHPHVATTFSNIGHEYESMGDYSKALEFYEKSHQIYEKTLLPNHPWLAISYNNIAQIYKNMGDYSKALDFYDKSAKIREMEHPPNYPSLATPYNNIGSVYYEIGDYSKALEFLEKALAILPASLPSNHPNFASTFSCFGRVYRSMKDYTKALHYFEKCIVIREQSLPERHPHRALTYGDIGDVYRLMGDYEKALSFHRKALNIQENIQCNPLECATTYVNLGETYREMNDYTTALTYFQKGLDILENKLPKNHPELAVVYHNLSKLYLSTRQYSLAMKNAQQTMDISQIKLPSTHPHLVDYRETFEKISNKM